jgi:hypothetical protein
MPYIGTSPSNGVRRVHTYTATASQTTFTGASSEGVTLSYADTNYIDVFQNGVLLGSADYTSTSGTSVVLAQGASADDLIVIVVYDVFSVADTVSKSSGGSFDSAVTMSNNLTVSGAFTSQGIDDNADATAITISSAEKVTLTQQIASKAPAFRATMGSAQTFSTDTFTVVNFNTEVFDTNSNYDTSNFRFTPTIAGYYFFNTQVFAGTTARTTAGFRKNGSNDTEVFHQGSNTNGGVCYEASAIIQLNGSSDYVDALFRHENGSDITCNNNTALTNFSGHLLMAT